MSEGFAAVPGAGRYVIANATIPVALLDGPTTSVDGLVRRDLLIADGRIEAIGAALKADGLPRLDLDGGMVWPTFVDMHTHIDKGHIWPRRANPDGTFESALASVKLDRDANWTAADVAARMEFSLRAAYAHGTALLRTHLDSLAPQHRISWPVFDEMRARWAGRIDLQAVSLVPVGAILDDAFAADLVALVKRYRGILGAATFIAPDRDRALERLFALAEDNGLDLDLHVDESEDPAADALGVIADIAIRRRFAGRLNVGHCCSLAVQTAAKVAATLDRVAEAGISVVSLPMCNLYLQDRHGGRTPRWRGVTLIHEMRERGIPVAVASDNVRDPFYAYGDMDMLEVFREAVRILHLDHPIAAAPNLVARTPGEILGRTASGVLAAGAPANLVLFNARDWTELLARPQSDRTVIRAGKAIDRTLPDYRDLDRLMTRSPVLA